MKEKARQNWLCELTLTLIATASMLASVALLAESFTIEQLTELQARYAFTVADYRQAEQFDYLIKQDDQGIYLQQNGRKAPGPIRASFLTGAQAHRRQSAGAELIIRALGQKQSAAPSVLDMTAGLGRDAFVLANWGCHVTLLERSAVAACLLSDGLKQAALSHDRLLCQTVARMQLTYGEAKELSLDTCGTFDCVYIDPMFPESKKSAKVKKDMRAFHDLIGADQDSAGLLSVAKSLANKRVIVKRPKKATYLDAEKPDLTLSAKAIRFDIYTAKR